MIFRGFWTDRSDVRLPEKIEKPKTGQNEMEEHMGII